MAFRRLLTAGLLSALLCIGGSATAWAAAAHGGPLSGAWSGSLTWQTSSGVKHERVRITINKQEMAGTWQVGAVCSGTLTLDSISDGYHHFLRHVAHGSTSICGAGNVDCLKRAGADLYDAVTAAGGGVWATTATLKPVRG